MTMSEKTVPDEKSIIEEILRRRRLNEPTIPSETFKKFKAKLGAEIERTGTLTREFVDQLLQQLDDGDL
jgi:hypothetical protein